MLHHRKLIVCFPIILLLGIGFVYAQPVKKPPNIILILTDDQGYGDVGCYGNDQIRTPHLDRMASEGMRFTSFYMAAAVCTPSRAALMTGCYPQRVGLPKVLFPSTMPRGQKDGKAIGLNPEEITIAEVLNTQGYRTACIGKWHLGDLPEFMPLNHGFDEYFGLPYSNDMMPGATPYDFDPLPLYERDQIIEYNPDQDLLVQQFTEKAIDFIENSKDAPFFLYLSHSMPHRPLHVSDHFAEKWFSPEQLSSIEGENKNSRDFLYPATIEELDWSVGKVLDKLKELNLENNTLVVFTSDNGPATGSAGPLRGKKGQLYEGGFRVPCIMKWEGTIPKGSVCEQLGTSMDIYATLANLSGAILAEDRVIDGVDIYDYLLGKEHKVLRDTFFYMNQDQGLGAVRYRDWKLFPGKTPQLYNLKDDISEKRNLAGENPEVVKQLTTKAEDFVENLDRNKRKSGLITLEIE